jgi:predicted amidohydrolase YtcJ
MRWPDRILYNGHITTQNPAQPQATALAIARGWILAAGSDDDIRALAGPQTRLSNLEGRTVIPGLTDAHIHWELTARALQQVNVFEVPTKQVALERVAARVAQTPDGGWISGHGWFQDIWPDQHFPTAADLDTVASDHPVYLSAKSGHAGWVNSRALALCGVTASTSDPAGGQIVRDHSGAPTGLLLETAMQLVAQHIPRPSPEQLADYMLEAQQIANASGLTGIHDFDDPSALRALQILRERGQLRLRVVKQINKAWFTAALDSGIRWGFGDNWIRFGALKLFADGALGPRTAHMIEAYDGEPHNFGISTIDPEEMTELMSQASAAGLPSTVHAIGDRAVNEVLNALKVVRQQEQMRGETPFQRRHRIEHVQIIHPDDAHRLAAMDIIASMQPLHATSDMLTSDQFWGKRSQWAYNPRLQLDQGARVAFGSDSPIEPFEPFKGIHAAVTRQRPDGSPGPDGWYPDARLSVAEALHGFTSGAAYAAGMEDRLGQLAPGFLADLVVMGHDIFSVAPSKLLHTPIVATMVNGDWCYGEL